MHPSGNKFENSPDALYQFRPKVSPVTVFIALRACSFSHIQAFELPEPQSPTNTDEDSGLSPTIAQGTSALLKRSGTVASYLAKTLKSTNTTSTEPPYRKARIAADEANEKYRVMVKNLDKLRLNLEERIEATLKQWGRWELDRLRGIKTGTFNPFPYHISYSEHLFCEQYCYSIKAASPSFRDRSHPH